MRKNHRPMALRAQLALFSLGAGLVVLSTGCTGSGDIKMVPLLRADFTEREPLVQDVPVNEAYYWVENNRVNIALRCRRESLLGPAFDYDWQASLVLDGLPAGSARLYKLKPDAMRIVETAGANQRRSRTWTGIAVIGAPERGRLKGRFHVNVRQQQFTLLGGWQPHPFQAPMIVVAGRFDAVEDAKRGRAILHETEASGFERAAKPVTQPSSSP